MSLLCKCSSKECQVRESAPAVDQLLWEANCSGPWLPGRMEVMHALYSLSRHFMVDVRATKA